MSSLFISQENYQDSTPATKRKAVPWGACCNSLFKGVTSSLVPVIR